MQVAPIQARFDGGVLLRVTEYDDVVEVDDTRLEDQSGHHHVIQSLECGSGVDQTIGILL